MRYWLVVGVLILIVIGMSVTGGCIRSGNESPDTDVGSPEPEPLPQVLIS
jgi:hypothetical protein